MSTPLYDVLKAYAAQDPARFHMPGHKGVPLPCPELAALSAIDVTELPPTGNLYTAGAPFDAAQALWAEKFGFAHCQFLTGGSTMGVHTAMTLCCPPGSRVLVDRGCHRSVFHALALLDLVPVYLERPWLDQENLCGPFPTHDVEKALDEHPEVKTICITSPTYSGLLSDIPAISALVHARGGKLIVDAAHGAHLPFLDLGDCSGADCVVTSAHKTLPALGQTALLFTNGFDPDQVRRTAAIYGSSSPSYPMLASLDVARDWMEREGTQEYRRVIAWAEEARGRFPALASPLPLDPARLTLTVQNGPAFAQALEARGIYPEMEDGGHVVFILTACDCPKSLRRLEEALEALRPQMGPCPPLPRPPIPQQVLTPRQALFAPARKARLQDCAGLISACQVAPYPPGVPVVAPGELISKKELSYLAQIGYNISSEITVVV